MQEEYNVLFLQAQILFLLLQLIHAVLGAFIEDACLDGPEPLPGLKELTGTLEEHWTRMIHEAIAKQAKTGIPRFEKAHVHIRITAPRGTNNSKVWDTSNRAINVIINNLKGIFFDDDDFEHMSCSIEASWDKIGMTEIRICDHRELRKSNVFR